MQALRRPLIAYARSTPRRPRGEPDTVYILLASAYGMGGTIRAALNLAGYLAGHRPVEVISVYRYRQEGFFGSFPPGGEGTAPDAPRRRGVAGGVGARPRGPLRARRSILLPH